MGNSFLCPKCFGHLKVGDSLVFSTRTKEGRSGLILLSPQLGNYKVSNHPSFDFKEGDYVEFFLCAFRTGMRLGELLGLKWRDIDWNQKFIRVERSYKRGRFDKTKTGRVRRVDMSNQLSVSLKNLLVKRKKEALKKEKQVRSRSTCIASPQLPHNAAKIL